MNNDFHKTLNQMDEKKVRDAKEYPEHSAGVIMTAEFIDIKKHTTVSQALKRIRKQGKNVETIYTLFVVSAGRKLEGTVSLKQFVATPTTTKNMWHNFLQNTTL